MADSDVVPGFQPFELQDENDEAFCGLLHLARGAHQSFSNQEQKILSPKPFERSEKSSRFVCCLRRADQKLGAQQLGIQPRQQTHGKCDPDLRKLMLTSLCHPETLVPDWFRSGCPSGMSASPTEVCEAFAATNQMSAAILKSRQSKEEQLSHQWRADEHKLQELLRHGGHLAESEVDRIAG